MNNFNWKPSDWLSLSRKEKALVIAGIETRIEEEKKQQKEAERRAKR
ncbi:hypothetical protein [Apilactobacillus xinyiensis]|nr:hypothetical protein [Apilactobacillus xinyiensis]MCL0330615.1 hypothetical protein [Apilactobacillus xinyiensis]